MKRVELKTGAINYKENILGILRTPKDPKEGATYEEMLNTIPLITKIDAVPEGEFVELSNTEHREIVSRFKNARYVVNSPETFEMIDEIAHAEGALKVVNEK